jgi:hypothetical protein
MNAAQLAGAAIRHRPLILPQIEDAHAATCRALSALRSIDPASLHAVEHAALARIADSLADAAAELRDRRDALRRGQP